LGASPVVRSNQNHGILGLWATEQERSVCYVENLAHTFEYWNRPSLHFTEDTVCGDRRSELTWMCVWTSSSQWIRLPTMTWNWSNPSFETEEPRYGSCSANRPYSSFSPR